MCRWHLPSCDFTQSHRSRAAFRSFGAVVLLMILFGSSILISWQIGLDGIRVGKLLIQDLHTPFPKEHPTSQMFRILSSRSDSGLPNAHSGAPVPGSPVAQTFHPYAVPPSPLPVSPSRPSRFGTPPLPQLASPRFRFSGPSPPPPQSLPRPLFFSSPLRTSLWVPARPVCCVHTTRQWFHRHRSDPSKTAVSVDISNAFNTVNRSAVLQSIRTHFPSLAPWVDCCYRYDSHLFTGVLALLAIGLFPVPGECNRGTLLGRYSSPLLSTVPFREHGWPLSVLSLRALTSAPSTWTTAFVRETRLQ